MRNQFDGAVSALLLCFAACLAGCAATPSDEPSHDESYSRGTTRAIIGGAKATAYPEAVLVDIIQNSVKVAGCSGSLIAPKVVLTAAHCLEKPNSTWQITAPYAGGQTASSSLGETFDWTGSALSFSNEHDVGLIYLSTPIKITKYPSIAQNPLSDGAAIVNIGRTKTATLSKTDLYVSKSITITSGAPNFANDYVAGLYIESGDSGGPVVQPGTHNIVAVNSAKKPDKAIELLARVDLVSDWVQMRVADQGGTKVAASNSSSSSGASSGQGGGVEAASCEHSPCANGDVLETTCDPCATAVCSADPYCCETEWDAQCVNEVGGFCGASCGGPSPVSCTHPTCAEGEMLAATCDPCVATVCAEDPYCCNTVWDAQCVGEVGSLCGDWCE